MTQIEEHDEKLAAEITYLQVQTEHLSAQVNHLRRPPWRDPQSWTIVSGMFIAMIGYVVTWGSQSQKDLNDLTNAQLNDARDRLGEVKERHEKAEESRIRAENQRVDAEKAGDEAKRNAETLRTCAENLKEEMLNDLNINEIVKGQLSKSHEFINENLLSLERKPTPKDVGIVFGHVMRQVFERREERVGRFMLDYKQCISKVGA